MVGLLKRCCADGDGRFEQFAQSRSDCLMYARGVAGTDSGIALLHEVLSPYDNANGSS